MVIEYELYSLISDFAEVPKIIGEVGNFVVSVEWSPCGAFCRWYLVVTWWIPCDTVHSTGSLGCYNSIPSKVPWRHFCFTDYLYRPGMSHHCIDLQLRATTRCTLSALLLLIEVLCNNVCRISCSEPFPLKVKQIFAGFSGAFVWQFQSTIDVTFVQYTMEYVCSVLINWYCCIIVCHCLASNNVVGTFDKPATLLMLLSC